MCPQCSVQKLCDVVLYFFPQFSFALAGAKLLDGSRVLLLSFCEQRW